MSKRSQTSKQPQVHFPIPKAVRHSCAWVLAERAFRRDGFRPGSSSNVGILNKLHYSVTALSHAAHRGL